ncbi:MAG: hypothetical protein KAI47_12710 [Deltaproteobacteria bacterium]|nr:hypothetical protein [Deltaproteobacteria bacterium]
MRELFADLPDIVERTAEVAALCTFDVGALTYSYPDEGLSLGESADEVLGSLARQGLVERLGAARAHELHGRLDHELSIIEELHYAGYFLTMWEVV